MKLKRKLLKEFVKFGIVGTIGVFVNLLVLYFLTEITGLFYIISAVFAFLVALTSNFILNKIWTFKEKISHKITSRYLKYFLVNVGALLINLVFLFVLTETLGIYYIFSQAISVALVFIFNFTGNKIWTFTG